MITLYTWKTPNGRKPAIALEELELPYTVVAVDTGTGAQRDPAYLALNPNGKIPTLVEEDGVDGRIVVFESAAILQYLADKTGRLLPREGQARADALGWLTWTVAGLAPNMGRWGGFARMDPSPTAALEVMAQEVARLFGVLEHRLGEASFLAGADYGVADISAYPWMALGLPMVRGRAPELIGPTPGIDRWLEEVGARPAVKRGMAVLEA